MLEDAASGRLPGVRSIELVTSSADKAAYTVVFDGPVDARACKLLFGSLIDEFGEGVAIQLGVGHSTMGVLPTENEYDNGAPVLRRLQELFNPTVPRTGWGNLSTAYGTYQVVFQVLGWVTGQCDDARSDLMEAIRKQPNVLLVTEYGETGVAITFVGRPSVEYVHQLTDQLVEPLGVHLHLSQDNPRGSLLSLFR